MTKCALEESCRHVDALYKSTSLPLPYTPNSDHHFKAKIVCIIIDITGTHCTVIINASMQPTGQIYTSIQTGFGGGSLA